MTDGQLTILNYPARQPGDISGGPCYRCVFPKPPPADQVTSCSDGGIIGPVVGVMGVLQALECIKLIIRGLDHHISPQTKINTHEADEEVPKPSLLIFSSMSTSPFRSVRLRGRRPDCFACSSTAGLSVESLESGSLDYVAFCGEVNPVTLLTPEERISPREYSAFREQRKPHILIDVREKTQFDICSLEGSINIPFSELQVEKGVDDAKAVITALQAGEDEVPVFVVCRLGNDSQVSTKKLVESIGGDGKSGRVIKDIEGGLRAWKKDVDKDWPEY